MSDKPKQKEENTVDKHVEVMVKDEGDGEYRLEIVFPIKGLRGNPVTGHVYGIGYVGDDEQEEDYVAVARKIAALFTDASLKIKRPVFEYFNAAGEKVDDG